MGTPAGYNSCKQVQSYFALYPVPVAALLWCGSPPEQVNDHLSDANETLTGIFSLPYMPCLEARCRAIHEAIENGDLPVCREKGVVVYDDVAVARRHIRREDLKAWVAKNFPDDKPAFLFDKVERNTHSSINTQAFQALQVELEAKDSELKNANEWVQKITKERDELKTERDEQQAYIEKKTKKSRFPNPRSEVTYLNIIGGMLELMLSSSPTGRKLSVYDNQAAIVDALESQYSDKQGISQRTLEEKFAEAKRNINNY